MKGIGAIALGLLLGSALSAFADGSIVTETDEVDVIDVVEETGVTDPAREPSPSASPAPSTADTCFEKSHPDAEQLHATAGAVLYHGSGFGFAWDTFSRVRESLVQNHATGAISDVEYTDLIHSWSNFESNYMTSRSNISSDHTPEEQEFHQVEVTRSLAASQSFLATFYSQLSIVLEDRMKTCAAQCEGYGNEERGDLSLWCTEMGSSQSATLAGMAADQRMLAAGSSNTSVLSATDSGLIDEMTEEDTHTIIDHGPTPPVEEYVTTSD